MFNLCLYDVSEVGRLGVYVPLFFVVGSDRTEYCLVYQKIFIMNMRLLLA